MYFVMVKTVAAMEADDNCTSIIAKANESIAELVVNDNANGTDWSIRNNIAIGSTIYGDRDYTLSSLPSGYIGSDWIQTANDSKGDRSDPMGSFIVKKESWIYIAHDDRIGSKPLWLLNNYTDTGDNLETTETYGGTSRQRSFSIYRSNDFVQANATVTLGKNGNHNSCSMYIVMVKDN